MRTLRLRLSRQDGYSLTELLVVMATLTIIMGGITGVFVSGMRAEVDAVARYDSQQNARQALGYLRREVHCASGLTQSGSTASRGTPARTYYSQASLTLPTGCPTGSGTVIWCTQTLGTNRYGLYRATDGACSTADRKFADYLKEFAVFSYTAPTSAELGKLHVEFPVDLSPNDASRAYTLEDDLALRNTERLP